MYLSGAVVPSDIKMHLDSISKVSRQRVESFFIYLDQITGLDGRHARIQ